MTIGVVGLGRLGICAALVFAKAGFEVVGIDINEERIKSIKNREKFFEPDVNNYLEKYNDRLKVSTDYKLLKAVSTVIVIPNTPSLPNGFFDVTSVKNIVKQVNSINKNALVVVSSNINIGTIDSLSAIHKRIAYNPEFVAQGSIIRDFENPKFVVIGAYTEKDAEETANIWRKVHTKPIYFVEPTEAEIIKLSLNVSYTLGITFANVIGEACEKFNTDSNKILDIIYQDRRNYKQGLGFMGPCFPRDTKCFAAFCLENAVGSGYRFASLLDELNQYTVERWIRKIKSMEKKRIGILGIAYKPNVPYIDESQALKIAQRLLSDGYEVYIYDSLAMENAKKILTENVHFCSTVEECVEKVDLVFIGTSNYSNTKIEKPVVNPWK
jgi:UDPglucose 6-dehydrogenase